MVDNGCDTCVMEVSSQGLKMQRVEGIFFDIGMFLNIEPDHIGEGEPCFVCGISVLQEPPDAPVPDRDCQSGRSAHGAHTTGTYLQRGDVFPAASGGCDGGEYPLFYAVGRTLGKLSGAREDGGVSGENAAPRNV